MQEKPYHSPISIQRPVGPAPGPPLALGRIVVKYVGGDFTVRLRGMALAVEKVEIVSVVVHHRVVQVSGIFETGVNKDRHVPAGMGASEVHHELVVEKQPYVVVAGKCKSVMRRLDKSAAY